MIVLFGLFALGQNANAPAATATSDRIIGSADLAVDAAVLRKAFEALHPGIY